MFEQCITNSRSPDIPLWNAVKVFKSLRRPRKGPGSFLFQLFRCECRHEGKPKFHGFTNDYQ